MKSNKEYRFKDNPKEKEFHDKFKELFEQNTLSAIVFGWKDDRQNYPKEYLNEREEDICINIIQWLGSPVGQGFLNSCGFVTPEQKPNNLLEQAEIVKQRLQYHFSQLDGTWDIPSGLPFMKEFLNEVNALCNLIKK